jgi:hypothetical protein
MKYYVVISLVLSLSGCSIPLVSNHSSNNTSSITEHTTSSWENLIDADKNITTSSGAIIATSKSSENTLISGEWVNEILTNTGVIIMKYNLFSLDSDINADKNCGISDQDYQECNLFERKENNDEQTKLIITLIQQWRYKEVTSIINNVSDNIGIFPDRYSPAAMYNYWVVPYGSWLLGFQQMWQDTSITLYYVRAERNQLIKYVSPFYIVKLNYNISDRRKYDIVTQFGTSSISSFEPLWICPDLNPISLSENEQTIFTTCRNSWWLEYLKWNEKNTTLDIVKQQLINQIN